MKITGFNRIKAVLLSEKKGVRLLLTVFSGVITGCCVTFPSFPGMIAEWAALIPVCLAIYSLSDERQNGAGRPVRRFLSLWGTGFLFFMSEYLVIYHWFVSMYPLEFTGMSKAAAVVVVIFGWVGLSVLGSLGGAPVFALIVLLCAGHIARKRPFIKPFIVAFLYPLFEWFETNFWTGVPWNRLGLGQLAGNFTLTLLSSSLLGPYFTTFLIVITSALVAYGIKYGRIKKYALSAACIFVANIMCGLCVISFSQAGKQVPVSAVQGNFSSSEKWSASMSETLDTYKKMTVDAAKAGAKIIVWPETALPVTLYDGSIYDAELSKLASDCGVFLCAGCFETIDGEPCNVLRCYGPDGTAFGNSYSKRHLVPFGEYIPERELFETLVPPLTEISILDRQLKEGTEPCDKLFDSTAVGFLICFDSIYETLSTDTVASGADIIFMATNDSWFGSSRALYMHEAQARLRAIENLTPVVRAANTGISACIDRFGREVTSSEPNEAVTVSASLEVSGAGALYSITGNFFVFVCAVVLCAMTGHEIGYCLKKIYIKKRR